MDEAVATDAAEKTDRAFGALIQGSRCVSQRHRRLMAPVKALPTHIVRFLWCVGLTMNSVICAVGKNSGRMD
jgi:hypothetical protein